MINRALLIDHHVHSNYSPDASKEATFLAYINHAKARGISRLVFTDHVDLHSPVELFFTQINYDKYFQEVSRLSLASNMAISVGVEMGYMPGIINDMSTFVNKYPFAYVICSIHVGDGQDFYNGDFFVGKTQEEAYKRYFEICLEAVRSYQDYDVFGHLDYIIRYGSYETRRDDFAKHQAMIEDILLHIIQNNKGIEINTSGLRYGLNTPHPTIDVLKSYKRLGGSIVTLGSDAHHPKDLQYGFDEALNLLKEAGFDSITLFENRQPKQVKI